MLYYTFFSQLKRNALTIITINNNKNNNLEDKLCNEIIESF